MGRIGIRRFVRRIPAGTGITMKAVFYDDIKGNSSFLPVGFSKDILEQESSLLYFGFLKSFAINKGAMPAALPSASSNACFILSPSFSKKRYPLCLSGTLCQQERDCLSYYVCYCGASRSVCLEVYGSAGSDKTVRDIRCGLHWIFWSGTSLFLRIQENLVVSRIHPHRSNIL